VSVLHFGWMVPELGIKYVWRKRWNFGFDFFSLPIGLGYDDQNLQTTAIYYRLLLHTGANF
jgi:hypothetical protein